MPVINDAVENSLLALGTRVLWIRDYCEIPSRFKQIYSTVRDDWNEVFKAPNPPLPPAR